MSQRIVPLLTILSLLCSGVVFAGDQQSVEQIIVTPEETDEILANPGMGWETFHRTSKQDNSLPSWISPEQSPGREVACGIAGGLSLTGTSRCGLIYPQVHNHERRSPARADPTAPHRVPRHVRQSETDLSRPGDRQSEPASGRAAARCSCSPCSSSRTGITSSNT